MVEDKRYCMCKKCYTYAEIPKGKTVDEMGLIKPCKCGRFVYKEIVLSENEDMPEDRMCKTNASALRCIVYYDSQTEYFKIFEYIGEDELNMQGTGLPDDLTGEHIITVTPVCYNILPPSVFIRVKEWGVGVFRLLITHCENF